MRIKTWNYIVFLCPKCGAIRYSRGDQKTASCFKCGYRIKLDHMKIKILFKTDKRAEAIEAVKRYKIKLAGRNRRKIL